MTTVFSDIGNIYNNHKGNTGKNVAVTLTFY